ncbi:MAG: bifunctional diaminohydroxyphosphoribosylaminopyrimidine deaminase/5-amino-6-(5-phosphoribosylamino)uracil reductase RibD [Armatimonadota bacterium]|nr:bifunctional diaminohydroxyphosphoribosylaminopyrimidine deaminase/5-amino-6-(5-phosphoribosylamino)uracil reductase RibD [Armatimonadota bacterium]
MALSKADLHWMRYAIRLARRGFPVPNPHVGAVVVKDGVLLGAGFHPYAGAPHAEVFALRQAGEHAQGATLYVSLEPCCHYGRTPPCTHAIIGAGVARVVIGTLDPNPVVQGEGLRQLQAAGIQAELLDPKVPDEAKLITELERINRVYLFWRRQGRPLITLKAALSLDGKIATYTGDSKWITGERARRMAHRLRAEHQAILVGIETVLRDRPHLTARLPGVVNQPHRLILDTHLRLSTVEECPVLDTQVARTTVFCMDTGEQALRHRADALWKRGVEVIALAPDPTQPSRVPVRKVVEQLQQWGYSSLLVEGGGQVAAAFLEARLADRIAYFYAPKLIGGVDARTALEGTGAACVSDAPRVRNLILRKLGDDWLVEGEIEYPALPPEAERRG